MVVQNKKYGNFVSMSSLTGKCTAQKLKKTFAADMDIFTSYGYIKKPK